MRVYIVSNSDEGVCGVYADANNALQHKYSADGAHRKRLHYVSVWDVLDSIDNARHYMEGDNDDKIQKL